MLQYFSMNRDVCLCVLNFVLEEFLQQDDAKCVWQPGQLESVGRDYCSLYFENGLRKWMRKGQKARNRKGYREDAGCVQNTKSGFP